MNKFDKRLLNPQLWGFDNGIFVPTWAVKQKPKDDLNRDIITYSTFAELFPKEQNSQDIIKKKFKEFWLNDVLQTLAKVNYLITFTQYSKTTNEELRVAMNFLKETAVYNFLKNRELRKIVTRQQLLANLRLAFLCASRESSSKKVFGNEKEFGELIYRITDFLEGRTGYIDSKNPTKQEIQHLYTTFARNMLFNGHSNFALSLTRYWYIFNKIASKAKLKRYKLKELFEKTTKVEYNHLLAVGFAIWGFYCESSKLQRISEPNEFLFSDRYFRNTSAKVKAGLATALSLLAENYDYYKKAFSSQKRDGSEHFNFSPFWNKPILKNESDTYYILDLNYLEERICEGAYWFIFDKAIADQATNNQLSKLKGEWGKIFESYVNEIVKNTLLGKQKRVFSEIDGENTGNVDLLILYPDTIYLIEITTKQVKYNEWIKSNFQDIKQELQRILIKDNKSKGRVIKLYEAINKIKNKEIDLGFDIKNIKNFIPIILFEKSPPMHHRLWHLYEGVIKEAGITDRQFLDDLDFWDVEEIEMVMADILKGNSLPAILEEKEKSGFFKDSMKNFYIMHRKHYEKHPIMEDAFTEMTNGFSKILFDKKGEADKQQSLSNLIKN